MARAVGEGPGAVQSRVDGGIGQAAQRGVARGGVVVGDASARVQKDARLVVSVDQGDLESGGAFVIFHQGITVRVREEK